VFIQFNANPDATFSPLPAKHVDTGMGFERATSIIQGTKNFQDFANAKISNYETDIFRPIFDAIEKLSGKKYGSTLPKSGSTGETEQEKADVAFRVIADHIRTLSFAIADRIQPGIKGRNGVLRSIHKRMVRYASTIEIKGETLIEAQDSLVDVLAACMGDMFPELRKEKEHIKTVLQGEAEIFNKTLSRGIEQFNFLLWHTIRMHATEFPGAEKAKVSFTFMGSHVETNAHLDIPEKKADLSEEVGSTLQKIGLPAPIFPGEAAFELFDTYGFPYDLTELMARERGLTVDRAGFEKLMEEQKKRSQDARVTQVIELSQVKTKTPTRFVGFEKLDLVGAKVLEVVSVKGRVGVILDTTPFYAEMGGQVGDEGTIGIDRCSEVETTTKVGSTFVHFLKSGQEPPPVGSEVRAHVESGSRNAIQRHHTVTHLMHWALHEVVSKEASQKGSFVGPDKLTFDFNSAALTSQQIADVEKLVNERILENAGVSWTEVPYAEVKSRKDVMQFFGDKYGDNVRVVQIGGHAGKLDGYSMELCGGTHTRATGEIGLFRIVSESAVAAGVRRIEAVAGLQAYAKTKHDAEVISAVAGKVNAPVAELEKKIEALLTHQKQLEKSLQAAKQKEAAGDAKALLAKVETINGIPAIIANISNADGDTLQTIADALKGEFKGVVVLGGVANGAVSLVATVSSEFTSKVQAGKIIQGIGPIVGGKGGGKPDNARGGGKDASKLAEALAKAKSLLG
jgi:alanyl-tRNA synthetase